jgi:phage anti-repressor protein
MAPRPKTSAVISNNRGSLVFPVNARDLYDAAGIASRFCEWFGARMRHHFLISGQDYVVHKHMSQSGHERDEYFITLRVAHNIAGRMRGKEGFIPTGAGSW